MQPGELYTQALIGAWEAVITYDAELSTSLWWFARRMITQRMWDQVRTELGRDLQRGNRVYIPVSDDDLRFIGSHEHGYDDVEFREMIKSILARLSPQHRELLRAIYMNEHTMVEVGLRVGVSESRICQVAKDARRRALTVTYRTSDDNFEFPMPRDSEFAIDGTRVFTLAPADN